MSYLSSVEDPLYEARKDWHFSANCRTAQVLSFIASTQASGEAVGSFWTQFLGRKMRRCSSQVESWIQVLRQDDTDEDQISVIDSQDLVDKVDKEDKVKDQMDKLNM